ncbi:MAG: 3-isopropylmalate dehydratase large subunit [Alphaproteobacteria bacterium]|nr:3-isopropylmalate dehydratase large subunit [Alphaproteobacteria bacterium]
MAPRTLFEKVWDDHTVLVRDDGQTLLYVGRHLAHDGSYHAFDFLKARKMKVRRPDLTYATPDHGVSTATHDLASITDPEQLEVVRALTANSAEHGVMLFDLDDDRQGIVHVVGPEQGITLPGLVMTCGDSHTSTHGALGALAFGVGASDVYHVLATQTTWQKKPKAMRITVEGKRPAGVTAKDIILAIIGKIGTNGGNGHVIEYAGSTIRSLSIEERLTVCNMSIEAGARAGMIAPDDTTFAYIEGRPFAPKGADWKRSVDYWKTLPSDSGATFAREVALDAAALAPMVTWGTSPEDVAAVTDVVPDPARETDADRRAAMQSNLEYMGLKPGTPLSQVPIDRVFIGSCTNARIEDLRAAAKIAKLGKVKVPSWVVPGSSLVKKQAEQEGLDQVFRKAGFEWRESGCSMCVGMNGDVVAPGQRCASTSNRNFRGRQGRGSRTHLMSPEMAAASALAGRIADVRDYLKRV